MRQAAAVALRACARDRAPYGASVAFGVTVVGDEPGTQQFGPRTSSTKMTERENQSKANPHPRQALRLLLGQ